MRTKRFFLGLDLLLQNGIPRDVFVCKRKIIGITEDHRGQSDLFRLDPLLQEGIVNAHNFLLIMVPACFIGKPSNACSAVMEEHFATVTSIPTEAILAAAPSFVYEGEK